MLKQTLCICFIVFMMICTVAFGDNQGDAPEYDALQYGAITFRQRCTLCHGNMGMGDGLLPLAIENYPATNLHSDDITITRSSIKRYLSGESGKSRHQYSPPWNEELSPKQIKVLIEFSLLLKEDADKAIALLKSVNKETRLDVSVSAGYVIYKTRCQICHGQEGKGDGHLSKVIKSPPPFNLSVSRAGDDELYELISKGGEEMQRSPSMPPWGDDLSESDLRSVILYINKVVRKK